MPGKKWIKCEKIKRTGKNQTTKIWVLASQFYTMNLSKSLNHSEPPFLYLLIANNNSNFTGSYDYKLR